ncbi:MAG TPA: hypothetical protein VHE37_10110 [Nevskiaceae bacterium]|nr:hypothetical protein [Nevskiaceae bacterium]
MQGLAKIDLNREKELRMNAVTKLGLGLCLAGLAAVWAWGCAGHDQAPAVVVNVEQLFSAATVYKAEHGDMPGGPTGASPLVLADLVDAKLVDPATLTGEFNAVQANEILHSARPGYYSLNVLGNDLIVHATLGDPETARRAAEKLGGSAADGVITVRRKI